MAGNSIALLNKFTYRKRLAQHPLQLVDSARSWTKTTMTPPPAADRLAASASWSVLPVVLVAVAVQAPQTSSGGAGSPTRSDSHHRLSLAHFR